MDIEKLKEVSGRILKGSEISSERGIYNGFIILFENEKILVYDSYDTAEKANDLRFRRYFEKHPQQLIYLWEEYASDNAEKEEWKKYIDADALGEWLTDNFDKFTSGRYKNSPYREEIFKNLKSDPVSKMEMFAGGDIGRLSTYLHQFFDLSEMIPYLQEMMESRIYEYDGFYFLPMVELPE